MTSGVPEGKKRLRSLRTLGLFRFVRGYRHAGPKGPEDKFFFAANAGEGQAQPRRRGFKPRLPRTE